MRRGHSLPILPKITAPRFERLAERLRLSDLAERAELSMRALSEHERGIRPLGPEAEARRRAALEGIRENRLATP